MVKKNFVIILLKIFFFHFHIYDFIYSKINKQLNSMKFYYALNFKLAAIINFINLNKNYTWLEELQQ